MKYLIYMNKQNLVLNYLQWLICNKTKPNITLPVGWGCRIHRLYLRRGVRPSTDCPGYDTKQSDVEVQVMLALGGMQGTPSFSSHPCPLWPGVVASDRVLSMGQIEIKFVLRLNWTAWNRMFLYAKLICLKWDCFFYTENLLMLNWIVWNRTVLTFNCV